MAAPKTAQKLETLSPIYEALRGSMLTAWPHSGKGFSEEERYKAELSAARTFASLVRQLYPKSYKDLLKRFDDFEAWAEPKETESA